MNEYSDRVLEYGQFNKREMLQSFDNFKIDSPEKQAVVNACQSFTKKDWCFLIGKTGVGKDHLASAMARKLVDEEKIRSVYSGTMQQILSKFRHIAYEGGGEMEAIHFFKSKKLLIIRDAGVKEFTEKERGCVIDLLDTRYANFLGTIVTGNMKPENFSKIFDERITDRLYEMGLRFNGKPFIPFTWGSYRKQKLTL